MARSPGTRADGRRRRHAGARTDRTDRLVDASPAHGPGLARQLHNAGARRRGAGRGARRARPRQEIKGDRDQGCQPPAQTPARPPLPQSITVLQCASAGRARRSTRGEPRIATRVSRLQHHGSPGTASEHCGTPARIAREGPVPPGPAPASLGRVHQRWYGRRHLPAASRDTSPHRWQPFWN